MTTEHVAAAIMHKSTPEQEATTREKTRRTFVDVQTGAELVTELLSWVTKNLPKSLSGPSGEFKVAGVATTIEYRAKTYVYVKLVDAKGEEPIGLVDEAGSESYEAPLNELEKNEKLASSRHKLILCLSRTYWMPKKKASAPKAPKATKESAAPREAPVKTNQVTTSVTTKTVEKSAGKDKKKVPAAF